LSIRREAFTFDGINTGNFNEAGSLCAADGVACRSRARRMGEKRLCEYDNCTPACYKNNPKEHDKCDNYCHCVTDDMQTQFSDHAQLVQDFLKQNSDLIAALQKIGNSCNQQIWGNPARKLKLQ
jgi:hypothetical protein